MQLSEKQKAIIRLINDERFTEEVCEKYWKAEATSVSGKRSDYSFYVVLIKEVNAFMRAVAGLEAVLEDREKQSQDLM